MSDTAIPDWLRDALHRCSPPVSEPKLSGYEATWPEPGEVWRATPLDCDQGGSRLVVVLGVDRSTGCVTVALASPEAEFATAEDLLVIPSETGLAYALLIETDLVGKVWRIQLDARLATIPAAVVELLQAHDQREGQERRGMPLQEDDHVRRRFKQQERAMLRALAAPCEQELHAGIGPVFADPALLQPPVAGAGEDAEALLLELLDQVGTGETIVPAWLLDLLMTDRSIAAWRQHSEGDVLAGLSALWEQAMLSLDREDAVADPSAHAPSSWRFRATTSPVADQALAVLVDRQLAAGHRCVRLASAARLWQIPGIAEFEQQDDQAALAVRAERDEYACQLLPAFGVHQ